MAGRPGRLVGASSWPVPDDQPGWPEAAHLVANVRAMSSGSPRRANSSVSNSRALRLSSAPAPIQGRGPAGRSPIRASAGARPLVPELLQQCPRVAVLVTSRTALWVKGGPERTATSGQLMLTTPILRPCTSRCGGLAVSGLGAARAHREGTWRIDDTRRQAHRPCHDRTRRRPGGGRPERRVVRRPACCRCCRC